MIRFSQAFLLILLLFGVPGPSLAEPSREDMDKAYELNRQAMIEMSEAKFEEAVDHFRMAVKLAPDYSITGKPFIYSPTFMAGWGLEKIGKDREACAEFKNYLALSGDRAEQSKKDHVHAFIRDHCK